MRFARRAAFVALAAASLAGCASDAARDASLPRPPNVVIVLADDLGWGDFGCYGSTRIPTPNVDALAARGLAFTRAYSGSAVCAPSRCVLLTGRHTGHAAVRNNVEVPGLVFGADVPEGQAPLPAGTWTVARELQSHGYHTAFVGKWGLGGPTSTGQPLDQGFDRFFGILCQRKAHTYYPTHLWSQRELYPLPDNSYRAEHERIDGPLASEVDYAARFLGSTYAPDLLIDEAERFVLEAAHTDQPFLLVYATPLPHVALQIPPGELDAFPRDWDAAPYLGEQGYVPHPRPRAAYAAMIARVDRDVGRLVAALDASGVGANTLVIVTSDNGPTYAGGVDAAFFDSARGLRGLKGSLYEGGVRVPFIAAGAGVAARGAACDVPIAFQDVAPTLLELAHVDTATGLELDGMSLASTFSGLATTPRSTPLYFELGRQVACISGRHKAVRREGRAGAIELYDLVADPSETHDLAGAEPELVGWFEERMQLEHRAP